MTLCDHTACMTSCLSVCMTQRPVWPALDQYVWPNGLYDQLCINMYDPMVCVTSSWSRYTTTRPCDPLLIDMFVYTARVVVVVSILITMFSRWLSGTDVRPSTTRPLWPTPDQDILPHGLCILLLINMFVYTARVVVVSVLITMFRRWPGGTDVRPLTTWPTWPIPDQHLWP